MPQYTFRCKKCQATVDVMRSIGFMDEGPTTEELPPTDACKHEETERVINSGHWTRGDNWSGRKGQW